MFQFGKRQAQDPEARRGLEEVRAELSRLVSMLRQLETEQSTMHDHVRKWMRRAVAAERAVERYQDPASNGRPTGSPATPHDFGRPQLRMWGARARIAARKSAAAPAHPQLDVPAPSPERPVGEPEPATAEVSDGLHP